MYDVFISYRRDGGHEMARLLYSELRAKGIEVFFDLEELGSGQFDVKLLKNIEESKNFVLILSPNALDRCHNESDWVRQEIEHAIACNKNIVPLMLNGFVWPQTLPKSLQKLPFYNGVQLIREYFDASITKLIELLGLEKKIISRSNIKEQGNESKVSQLLKRVFMFLEDSKWTDANKYCEKVLDIDPENADAYLGKLLAELNVSEKARLEFYNRTFEHSENYNKIMRFGSEELIQELKLYNSIIYERNEENRKSKIYNNGCELAKNKTPEKQVEAAEEFEKLIGYRDADERAKACRQEVVLLQYNLAIKMAEKAKTSEQYIKAREMFLAIKKYPPAIEKAKECKDKENELTYIDAVQKKMSSDSIDGQRAALDLFRKINGYKDSNKLAQDCLAKIDKMEKEIEHQKAIEEVFRHQENIKKLKKARVMFHVGLWGMILSLAFMFIVPTSMLPLSLSLGGLYMLACSLLAFMAVWMLSWGKFRLVYEEYTSILKKNKDISKKKAVIEYVEKRILELEEKNKKISLIKSQQEQIKTKDKKKKINIIFFVSAILGIILCIILIVSVSNSVKNNKLKIALENDTFTAEFVEDNFGNLQNKKSALKIVASHLEDCYRENDLKATLKILTVLAGTDCSFRGNYYNGSDWVDRSPSISPSNEFVEWVARAAKEQGTEIEIECPPDNKIEYIDYTYEVDGYKISVNLSPYSYRAQAIDIYIPSVGWYDVFCYYESESAIIIVK